MTEQGNIATELETAGVPQDAMRRLAELQPGRAGSIFRSASSRLTVKGPTSSRDSPFTVIVNEERSTAFGLSVLPAPKRSQDKPL